MQAALCKMDVQSIFSSPRGQTLHIITSNLSVPPFWPHSITRRGTLPVPQRAAVCLSAAGSSKLSRHISLFMSLYIQLLIAVFRAHMGSNRITVCLSAFVLLSLCGAFNHQGRRQWELAMTSVRLWLVMYFNVSGTSNGSRFEAWKAVLIHQRTMVFLYVSLQVSALWNKCIEYESACSCVIAWWS